MIVTVKTAFVDKHCRVIRRVGEQFEADNKRAKELSDLGVIEAVKIKEDKEEQPKPKKAPAKKRK